VLGLDPLVEFTGRARLMPFANQFARQA